MAQVFYDDLLKKYDKRIQPYNTVAKRGDEDVQITRVDYDLHLHIITHVEVTNNRFGALMGVYQEWIDPRLTWNSTSPTEVIQIPRNLVWTPNFVFYGVSPTEHFPPINQQLVSVHPNGKVEIAQNINFIGYCWITAEYFPYDVHMCFMKALNFHQNVFFIHKSQSFEIHPFLSPMNPSWWISFDLIKNSTFPSIDGREELLVDNAGNFVFQKGYPIYPFHRGVQMLFMMFELARKPAHALHNVVIPIYLLACMNCFTFLVPVESGERIGLIMTIQLGVIFSMTLIEANAAPSGDFASPLIVWFIYYVFACGMFSLSVILIHDRLEDAREASVRQLSRIWNKIRKRKVADDLIFKKSKNTKMKSGLNGVDIWLFVIFTIITVCYIFSLNLRMLRQYPNREFTCINKDTCFEESTKQISNNFHLVG